MVKYCIHTNCKKSSCYGIKGGLKKDATFCVSHKPVDYVDVVHKTCISKGCKTIPNYGIKGGTKKDAEYCVSHKPVDYVDVVNKKCIFEGCKTKPNYGIKGGLRKDAKYCVSHKPVGYVDVISKTCISEGCKTIPNYGIKGGTRKDAEYCVSHKPVDYVDVISKTCISEGCKTRPSYGIEGGTKKDAEYCVSHKPVDYVNVVNKKCIFEGCKIQSSYGIEGGTRKDAEYCVSHKPVDYVNVVNKKCIFEGCKTKPSYGIKGGLRKDAKYCVSHKPFGYVNVVDKTCISKGCESLPMHGPLFKEKIHCSMHKTPNDYKNNKPICEYKDCKINAYYTKKNIDLYPTRCEEHSDDTYYNIIEKECTKCNLLWIVNENGLCNDCNEFFKEKPKTRKEKVVVNYLKTKNELKIDSTDKIPDGSCNKYRPDIVYDFGTHIIIIEIDESQHKTYECRCEQARMINITQDYGGIPVTFIRFNPDSYIDKNNKKQNSKIEDRLGVLSEIIDKIKNIIPKELCSVIYLYYDGFDKKEININTINIDTMNIY